MKDMLQQGGLSSSACQTPPNIPDEVDVPSDGRVSISLQTAHRQPPLRAPTLWRSDDTPGIGAMCGGKEQAQQPATFSTSPSISSKWQEKLNEKCRDHQLKPSVYETFSDRRGGRTACSCKVYVSGQLIAGRYWYDGQYLNNTREDAAELALKRVFNCT